MARLSCVLCLVLAATGAAAQTTPGGSLRGVVVDQQGGRLPGVAVTVRSPTVPGMRSAQTDARGEYWLGDLPPGTYELRAELQGFSTVVRAGVIVSAGLNVTADVEMTVGEVGETIEVRQDTPLLETQSGLRAVNVAGETLRSLPTVERREWWGAVMLTPGVTSAETANNEKLMYVHGADGSDNVVQIDGADMTPAGAATLRYNALNLDAIDDIQVKTAGVDASAPLGEGGIINIATASGTNRVKGAATFSLQPLSWNASNTPGGTSAAVDQRQIDLSLGGPIKKDHVWGFGSYRGINTSVGISRTAAQLDALRALVPGFTPFDSTNVSNLWFAKLTAQRSSSHQFAAFIEHDVNPTTFADAVTAAPRDEATGGTGASLRLSSIWSNHLTTRVSAAYNDKRRDVLHASDPTEPLERVYLSTITSSGVLVGNGRVVDRGAPLTGGSVSPNSRVTLSFDTTVTADGRTGAHQLQAGVYAQPRIEVEQLDYYPNGGYVFEESVLKDPNSYAAGVIPFHRTYLSASSALRAKRRGQDLALYVQDAWQPTPRLTINPGVRIDRIVWTDQMFNTTTERSTNVGPRLGVNYAVTADARDVVRAHWVRVHSQASQLGVAVGSSSLSERDLYDLNLDGVFETELDTPATFGITSGRTIDPNLHQPYVNEWGVGYSHQFAGQTTAGLDFTHRAFRDRPTLLDTNSVFNGQVFAGYRDPNYNQIYEVTNNTWNWPVYSSLELTVTKRTARVQAIAGYARQWRHIAGTWQPNDPASVIQPGAFDNDRGIGGTAGSTSSTSEGNSLSGTNMTQAQSGGAPWHDHTVTSGLTWRGPADILLATTYIVQSGGWSGPIITRVAASDPAFGPAIVTLSNGRRVSNPLATTLRFAGATRSDGQLTTPILQMWNARAGRRFSVHDMTFDASIDVFNITNNGADQMFQLSSNQTYNPLFGATQYKQLPRSAQFVIRFAF